MKNITIGITLDLENTKSYSKFPWYAARQNYSDSVVKAGGTPVFIPHNEESISSFLDLIDGLVITGGDFDINPNLYGEKKVHKKVNLKNKRTNFFPLSKNFNSKFHRIFYDLKFFHFYFFFFLNHMLI